MTALSANKPLKSRKLGLKYQYPVAASTTLYQGSLCMVNSGGYLEPAAASVNNNGCVGISTDKVDNSSGAAGAKWATVQEGEYLLVATTAAQSVVQDRVYAEDDATVDETQGSNEPQAGLCTEFVSSTSLWVLVSPLAGKM